MGMMIDIDGTIILSYPNALNRATHLEDVLNTQTKFEEMNR